METSDKLPFISKNKQFYSTLFGLLGFVALQNVIGFTVNMADNVMLGRYAQDALSGAAVINQIFFLIQQFGVSVSNTLVALSSQYWGEGRLSPIRILSGYALKLSGIVGVCLIIIGMFIPRQLCMIFTADEAVIEQGSQYMMIVVWSFAIYCITVSFYAALRAVGIVKISFYVSIVTLVVNCGINYVLIFGKLGMPEMGIRGAAVGTLISRIIEFLIVVIYCKKDKKLDLFRKELFSSNRMLRKDFYKIYIPNMLATVIWGISIPVQTAILGHMKTAELTSADIIAANNVATTFYQYAKVITMAMSQCCGVMIGQAIGMGKRALVKQAGRTLSVLTFILGVILAVLMYVLKNPLLSIYTELTPSASALAESLIILQAVIMVGMAYQMPVSFGIIQGGGDAKFTMKMNMVCTWLIVMPFTLMGAFWWHVPIVWLVLIIQSDQLFKCLPVWIKFKSYTWIKKLTRDEESLAAGNA